MDQTMRADPLPAPLIIRDFVKGEENSNYEKYLIELLNNSSWFSRHFPGVFVSPSSESNGECDAFNEHYQIDFKLFASQTLLQARSLLDYQVVKLSNGVIAHSTCRSEGNSIETTRLFAALRGKSLEDLHYIRKSNCKKNGIEKDIKTALKTLETQKNILLFFPYAFSFDTPHEFSAGIMSIQEALENDFSVAFVYRKEKAPQKDTYITCLYSESFLLFSVSNGRLSLCDSIETKKLKTYKLLEDYTKWF